MSRAAAPTPRAGFEIWVARALAGIRADLPRKARFVRGLAPRLGEPGLKGLTPDDLSDFARRLEAGA